LFAIILHFLYESFLQLEQLNPIDFPNGNLPLPIFTYFLGVIVPYVIVFATLIFNKKNSIYIYFGFCLLINTIMIYGMTTSPGPIDFGINYIIRESFVIEFILAIFLIILTTPNKEKIKKAKLQGLN
jgi:hypothetical protein